MRHLNQQSQPASLALELEREEKAEKNTNRMGFYPFMLVEYEMNLVNKQPHTSLGLTMENVCDVM